MKYRLITIYLFLCLVLMNLSNCGVNLAPPVELLEKPKLNLDQQFVIELIMSIVPYDSYIARPMKSKSVSSVGFVDINGDGNNEIYAFYVDKNAKNVGLILVHKKENEWKLLNDIKLSGTDIAYADFINCDKDWINEFVIGTIVEEQLHKNLYILKSDGLNLNIAYKDFYSELVIDDFDEDRRNDIAIFKLDRNNYSYAEILKFDGEQVEVVSKVELDPYISAYYNIQYGNISRDQKAFVLDFETGSKSATNILLYEKNVLFKVFDSFELDPEYKRTLKLSPIKSQDIDKDGLIEIANNFKINSNIGKPKNSSGLIIWNNYYRDSLIIKKMFFLGDKNHIKIDIPRAYVKEILDNSLELVDYNLNGKDYQLDFYIDLGNKFSKFISLKKLNEKDFKEYIESDHSENTQTQSQSDDEIIMDIVDLKQAGMFSDLISDEALFEMLQAKLPNIKAYYKDLGIIELNIKNAQGDVYFIKFNDLDYTEHFYSAHSLIHCIAKGDYETVHDTKLLSMLLQFDDLIKNIDFI